MKNILVIAICSLAISCGSNPKQNESATVEDSSNAKKIYNAQCTLCHGVDGKKGLAGAKIIPESTLSLEGRIQLITKGKGNMMPFEGILSEEEIKAVAEYTLTLE